MKAVTLNLTLEQAEDFCTLVNRLGFNDYRQCTDECSSGDDKIQQAYAYRYASEVIAQQISQQLDAHFNQEDNHDA